MMVVSIWQSTMVHHQYGTRWQLAALTSLLVSAYKQTNLQSSKACSDRYPVCRSKEAEKASQPYRTVTERQAGAEEQAHDEV